MSHFWAWAQFFGYLIAYPVIFYFLLDCSGGCQTLPLHIFLNVIAKGFTLTFEQFYLEVVFPLSALGFYLLRVHNVD